MTQIMENILAGIGVTDVIDILLVAFIIYKVLGFINDSGAEQILRGILLLVVVAFLSDFFQLYTLNYFLKGTLAVGVLAIIILFQPELRRAFDKLGRGGLFKKAVVANVDQERAKAIVGEFVEAVEDMAAERTGALIVFERETNLNEICATGTVIKADVSAQMIENIFYKGSPLHDGALIVSGAKLYAAGCVLPLTENLDIPKSLGTRHRAGIGVTEISDSVAVIVSEETGIVTMVTDGQLERYLDGKTLEKRLLALYLGNITDSGAKIKEIFGRRKEGEK